MKNLSKATAGVFLALMFAASPSLAGFQIDTPCPFQDGCSDVLVIYNAQGLPVRSVWGNEAAEDFVDAAGVFHPNTFVMNVPQAFINPRLPGYAALLEPGLNGASDIYGIVRHGVPGQGDLAFGFQSPFLSAGVDPVLGNFVGQLEFLFDEPGEGVIQAFTGTQYLNPDNPDIKGWTMLFISVDAPFGTTHIPEPNGLALIGLALAMLGLRRSR